MTGSFSRRDVLKSIGALSTTAAAPQYPTPSVSASLGNNEKLNIAVIGCGERARAHLPGLLGENLVAVASGLFVRRFHFFFDPDARIAGSVWALFVENGAARRSRELSRWFRSNRRAVRFGSKNL
jgi:hypothetical protein